MTIPFACVIAMMVLLYLSKVPVAISMARLGGYDNHHPREQQARLTGWGKRALGAHQNGFEIFPVFAAGVFIAHLTQADAHWSAVLAIAFVVLRVLYIGLYIADIAALRSVVFISGFGISLALALLGCCHGQA